MFNMNGELLLIRLMLIGMFIFLLYSLLTGTKESLTTTSPMIRLYIRNAFIIYLLYLIYTLLLATTKDKNNNNNNNNDNNDNETFSNSDTLSSYHRNGLSPMICTNGKTLESDVLCYQPAKKDYSCKGQLCLQDCPKGYKKSKWDSNQCLFTKNTIASYTDLCPWYDRCGLSAAKGCSKCPPGYEVDGCLCHQVEDRFKRGKYNRPVGTSPTECQDNFERSMGSCYPACREGYVGKGKICYPIAKGNPEVSIHQYA